MKFSLDHPYKYEWIITSDASDVSILSDLVRSCKVKGLANVSNLLQSQQVHGIVIVNKNSEPSTLFQHLPILTFLNSNDNLLITVSQTWSEEVYFIHRSEIDESQWSRLNEIGKINLPIASNLKYVPVKLQC